MSTEDLKRLDHEIARQSNRTKVSYWVSIGLNVILWGLYLNNPAPELIGIGVAGILCAAIFIILANKSANNLRKDLRDGKKEIITGEIQRKRRIQLKHSTHFEFMINDLKYPVSSKIYNEFDDLDTIILERTLHGKVILSSARK